MHTVNCFTYATIWWPPPFCHLLPVLQLGPFTETVHRNANIHNFSEIPVCLAFTSSRLHFTTAPVLATSPHWSWWRTGRPTKKKPNHDVSIFILVGEVPHYKPQRHNLFSFIVLCRWHHIFLYTRTHTKCVITAVKVDNNIWGTFRAFRTFGAFGAHIKQTHTFMHQYWCIIISLWCRRFYVQMCLLVSFQFYFFFRVKVVMFLMLCRVRWRQPLCTPSSSHHQNNNSDDYYGVRWTATVRIDWEWTEIKCHCARQCFTATA